MQNINKHSNTFSSEKIIKISVAYFVILAVIISGLLTYYHSNNRGIHNTIKMNKSGIISSNIQSNKSISTNYHTNKRHSTVVRSNTGNYSSNSPTISSSGTGDVVGKSGSSVPTAPIHQPTSIPTNTTPTRTNITPTQKPLSKVTPVQSNSQQTQSQYEQSLTNTCIQNVQNLYPSVSANINSIGLQYDVSSSQYSISTETQLILQCNTNNNTDISLSSCLSGNNIIYQSNISGTSHIDALENESGANINIPAQLQAIALEEIQADIKCLD